MSLCTTVSRLLSRGLPQQVAVHDSITTTESRSATACCCALQYHDSRVWIWHSKLLCTAISRLLSRDLSQQVVVLCSITTPVSGSSCHSNLLCTTVSRLLGLDLSQQVAVHCSITTPESRSATACCCARQYHDSWAGICHSKLLCTAVSRLQQATGSAPMVICMQPCHWFPDIKFRFPIAHEEQKI